MRVDRSRFYLAPAVTPLAYTASYAGWSEERQRRSNQLTALAFNEGIAFFERSFSAAVVAAREELGAEDELAGELDRFLADEARHADGWDRLNRVAEPCYYGDAAPRPIAPPPRLLPRLVAFFAARPRLFPCVFWWMLALEEHSLHISRCCSGCPEESLDPTFREAYREHARDEARHVRLDLRLIERFYAPLSPPLRRLNAALLHAVLTGPLLAPGRLARAVVGRLVEEQPDLGAERQRIERELAALRHHPGYRAMMYSPRATPLLFAALARFEELAPTLRRLGSQTEHPLGQRLESCP